MEDLKHLNVKTPQTPKVESRPSHSVTNHHTAGLRGLVLATMLSLGISGCSEDEKCDQNNKVSIYSINKAINHIFQKVPKQDKDMITSIMEKISNSNLTSLTELKSCGQKIFMSDEYIATFIIENGKMRLCYSTYNVGISNLANLSGKTNKTTNAIIEEVIE